ncbi:hypothetical protein [Natronobiforma cellulositropha]|uniref:hypothetical protein n=1 Tax=Natronobiforma cellulositropha TaxID=1679076 RepID=UPI0021D5C2F4|nr:hypothetical protein [Natronobiforma cellulositropha]
MSPTVTEDDVGKTVVNAGGETVGVVAAVDASGARVDPSPGVTDTIRAALGWESATAEALPLDQRAIESITDDEVRLRGDLSAQGDVVGDSRPDAEPDRQPGDETVGTEGRTPMGTDPASGIAADREREPLEDEPDGRLEATDEPIDGDDERRESDRERAADASRDEDDEAR